MASGYASAMEPSLAAEKAFDGRAFARTLGSDAGVYRMFDAEAHLLYVGKAKNLRRRVESYFSRPQLDSRLASMVRQVARIEVIVTRTEVDALLLENRLIKTLKPRYNIELKDDKSYPYLFLPEGEAFPRLQFYRGARDRKGRYFGPFVSAWAVRETLSALHRLFQLRSCEDAVFRSRTRPCLEHQLKRCSAPCVGLIREDVYADQVRLATLFLEGRSNLVCEALIVQMDAAAQALDFERAAELRDRLAALQRVQAKQSVEAGSGDLDVVSVLVEGGIAAIHQMSLRGGMNRGGHTLLPRLPTPMEAAVLLESFLVQHYADHALPPEILLHPAPVDVQLLAEALSALAAERGQPAPRLVSAPRADRARWLEMSLNSARAMLAAELLSQRTLASRYVALNGLLGPHGLPERVERIECFDISHTMGEATVASCVVFGPEGPLKHEYRRYNIEGVTGGDDYAAMEQALRRRFLKVRDGDSKAPDLLLIDGGRGQLTRAFAVLDELGVPVPLTVGVAKGEARKAGAETLLVGRAMIEITPGGESLASHLIQQVRDEAHRFAITGHRARRAKARNTSPLEDIEGIGPKRRQALLKQFGGLRGLKRASVDDLLRVPGISAELATRIVAALKSG
jgi:excinuclease ABC subunit C